MQIVYIPLREPHPSGGTASVGRVKMSYFKASNQALVIGKFRNTPRRSPSVGSPDKFTESSAQIWKFLLEVSGGRNISSLLNSDIMVAQSLQRAASPTHDLKQLAESQATTLIGYMKKCQISQDVLRTDPTKMKAMLADHTASTHSNIIKDLNPHHFKGAEVDHILEQYGNILSQEPASYEEWVYLLYFYFNMLIMVHHPDTLLITTTRFLRPFCIMSTR